MYFYVNESIDGGGDFREKKKESLDTSGDTRGHGIARGRVDTRQWWISMHRNNEGRARVHY